MGCLLILLVAHIVHYTVLTTNFFDPSLDVVLQVVKILDHLVMDLLLGEEVLEGVAVVVLVHFVDVRVLHALIVKAVFLTSSCLFHDLLLLVPVVLELYVAHKHGLIEERGEKHWMELGLLRLYDA